MWAQISVISLTESEFKFVLDINLSIFFIRFFSFLSPGIQVSQSGTFPLASTLKYFAGSHKNTSLSLVGQEEGNHGQSTFPSTVIIFILFEKYRLHHFVVGASEKQAWSRIWIMYVEWLHEDLLRRLMFLKYKQNRCNYIKKGCF